MTNRMLVVAPLLAAALLAGCGGDDGGYQEDDGAIPAGAIPAAPDVRPGTQSASGNVVQSGAPAGGQDEPAVNRAGATQASVDAAATAAAPDTAR